MSEVSRDEFIEIVRELKGTRAEVAGSKEEATHITQRKPSHKWCQKFEARLMDAMKGMVMQEVFRAAGGKA